LLDSFVSCRKSWTQLTENFNELFQKNQSFQLLEKFESVQKPIAIITGILESLIKSIYGHRSLLLKQNLLIPDKTNLRFKKNQYYSEFIK
jgi:hypothetical protein